MSPSAVVFRQLLDTALEGHALNRAQRDALLNFDPEAKSLVGHIVALRRHGIPQPVLRELLDQALEVIRLNDTEHEAQIVLTGQLDELTTMFRRNETTDSLHRALGVKAIARALRQPLAQLADSDHTDSVRFFHAAAAITDVLRNTTPDRLRAPSLRHELGAGPHDRLLSLLEVVSPC